MADESLDIEARRREKQASRDEDDRAITTGEKTVEEVARESSFFSGFTVTVDLSRTGLPGHRPPRR